jgi:hypothetical protein
MEDRFSKARTRIFSLRRFMVCMGLALAIGVITGFFFVSKDKPPFRFLELVPLILYYVPFCLFFLAVMLSWNKWLHGNIYTSWLLAFISVLVLVVGLYTFPISQYHGVHLILASCLGFFLSSIDQLAQRFKAASSAGIRE